MADFEIENHYDWQTTAHEKILKIGKGYKKMKNKNENENKNKK